MPPSYHPRSPVPGMRASSFAELGPEDLPCGHDVTRPECVHCMAWDATHSEDEIIEVAGTRNPGECHVRTREGKRYKIFARDTRGQYPQLGHLITEYKHEAI